MSASATQDGHKQENTYSVECDDVCLTDNCVVILTAQNQQMTLIYDTQKRQKQSS